MGRERADVYAKYLAQQVFVGDWKPAGGARKRALACVGPNQEGTATAGWIEYSVLWSADAEDVNEVYNIRVGVELAEAPSLASTDQPFVHPTDHVKFQIGKVKFVDSLNQASPM